MGFLFKIQDKGGVWRQSFAGRKGLWKPFEFKGVNLGVQPKLRCFRMGSGDHCGHTTVVIAELRGLPTVSPCVRRDVPIGKAAMPKCPGGKLRHKDPHPLWPATVFCKMPPNISGR